MLQRPLDGAGAYSPLSDRTIGTCFGGDNSNGHQGYANAKRGAKKFVRSRVRFHEDRAARELARDALIGDL
ncbi:MULTISPECIES: hypothetical protein [unclassified Variovorax]|uniref:hypothetical protein n=1 Tax=unclassified Variovorax TaxID=663243 RepID=UPI00076D8DB2|nr:MULTISPECIES: hypothetical protein [unclassified Variovorax]KWT98244.1 hypothetical protein APY03_0915 [Variovorax sp. WDL1]PNG50255.1 hypothetical protein CHC06_05878 [Variovorax sp. B2]PNG51128.1 hypothetical protein CHC07_05784 [Variovorax sp. B4]VTV17328.1 hypothetical protein WDL1P1_00299 [Variovorax sp. WDL1]